MTRTETTTMSVFFCQQTGVRIVAPGVSKSVDPVNGQDEHSEPSPPAADKPPSEGDPALKSATDPTPQTPPTADAGVSSKPPAADKPPSAKK